MNSGKKDHYYYIDILRVMSICLVIALHCISGIIVSPMFHGSRVWLGCMLANSLCRAGVPLFFMISGFLSLNDEKANDIAGFYKNRFKRIIPALVIWNVVYYLFYANLDGKAVNVSDFIGGLLNGGNAYHMWYVYTIAGIYLLTPFIKRIVDTASGKELFLLFMISIIPTTVVPFLNIAFSASVYLFDPLLNGYIGYYLLGYMLGKYEISVNLRAFIYVCGIAGFAVGFIGNIISSANDAGDLIFNMGYSLPSYLVAAALFVLVKYGSGNRLIGKAAPVLTPMAEASFGVYWIHALVLRLVVGLPPLSRSPAVNLSAVFLSVTACSFGVTLVAKRVLRSRKSNGGGCNSS